MKSSEVDHELGVHIRSAEQPLRQDLSVHASSPSTTTAMTLLMPTRSFPNLAQPSILRAAPSGHFRLQPSGQGPTSQQPPTPKSLIQLPRFGPGGGAGAPLLEGGPSGLRSAGLSRPEFFQVKLLR